MSRFNLGGSNYCEKCQHYRRSNKCQVWRCDEPENLSSNWMGTVYMKTPDNKNYNHKCKDYKEKKNER